jgi:osmotically-inducible protein OsmY
MKLTRLTLLATTLILIIGLQGCVPLIVGGGAAGVSMIHDRRTAGAAMEDQNIELKAVRLEYDDPEIKDRTSVSATSYNMLVLLTGQAETEELRDRYVDKIKQIPHVKKVVDEIQIGPTSSLAQNSSDSYITSKVKVKMFDIEIPDFDPTRVKIITEMGTVYLMGLLTHQEADAVVEKARYVEGVTRVVKVFEYVD